MELLKHCLIRLSSIYLHIIMRCKVHNEGFVCRIKIKEIASNASIVIGRLAHLSSVKLKISDSSVLEIGSSSRLTNVEFLIKGKKARVVIGSCCMINNTTFWIEDSDCSIIIGDNTYIGGAHIAVTGNHKSIIIGCESMLSDGIVIRTGDSHAIIDESSGTKINPEQDVVIDDHVWIAQNATILKGSHLFKDSVVGCNSVVCGVYDSNSLIAGVPARVLKIGINWDKDRMLD